MSETSTTVTHPDGTTITVTTAGENTAEPKPGQTGTDLLADVSIAGQAQIDIYDVRNALSPLPVVAAGGGVCRALLQLLFAAH